MNSGWLVTQNGYEKENIEFLGSKFTIGNGYFGYRGTLEEFGSQQLAACTVSELYDDSGNGWREILNVPNPLFTSASVSEISLSVLDTVPAYHEQYMLLDTGVHGRKTVFSCEKGSVSLCAQRFASIDNVHLLCMKYTVTADFDTVLTLKTGIDSDLWELNGPHFKESIYSADENAVTFIGTTKEKQYKAAIARCTEVLGEAQRTLLNDSTEQYTFDLKAGQTSGITVFSAICKCTDCKEPLPDALEQAHTAQKTGWEKLLENQQAAWKKRWNNFDVEIGGDDEAQLALRHSIFLLTCAAPFHTGGIAIPARGLSGQVYKGGMFWDTELYFLQMFLHCAPEVARNLVSYRIKNLGGALEKAAEEGYTGAFYPWESQETGQEGCTYYNLTDIFTNRPVRTYFRDKQIHISAAAAHGILEYVHATGDMSILAEGGAKTLLECAEFFWSYAYYKAPKHRFELLDVTGPDEYHERVNNSAYTNAMAKETAEGALWALDMLKQHYPQEYSQLERDSDLETKKSHAAALEKELYVPSPRPEDGVIPQYDGFFSMEDCSLDELKSRIINPNEYLGSPTGLTVNTQIAKQADITLLLCVKGGQYSQDVKIANWEYYEPRCEHGSSLSTCMYALLAAQIGKTEWAYKFFMRAAQTDLLGGYKLYLGTLYIGGTHPAANGGSWMVAVQGFGGLSIQDGCAVIAPHLPSHWTHMRYRFSAQGQWFTVKVSQTAAEVTADAENSKPLTICCSDKQQSCAPSETVIFKL